MSRRGADTGVEPDYEPYVAAPSERLPRSRLAPLQPWLWCAIVLLLGLAVFVMGLSAQRQDPSLDVPVPGGAIPALPDEAPAGADEE